MDKLQQLTDRLYNEGLSKGKAEGEALLAAARAESEEIVSKAKAEAEAIISAAKKEAEDLKKKVEGDVRMATSETLQATRGDIESMIVTEMTGNGIDKALSNEEFLKGIITEVAKRFSAQEPGDLSLVLPEKLQGELEPFVKNELSKILGKGVDASFSKKIAGGFRIAPKDGSYFISLTDETFKELISEYLRPATKKILFG